MKKIKAIKNSKIKISIAIISGIISSIITILICAFIMSKYDIGLNNIKYMWIAISIIPGIISGFTAGNLINSKGILWGSVTSLVCSIIVVLSVSIINNFSLNYFTYIIFPLEICFGAIGGIIGTNI